MATPQGVAHVEAALALLGQARERVEALKSVEESWRAAAVSKLGETSALLRGTLDRFYLKTKVCLPFARRCEERARALEALLAEETGEQAQLRAAIEAAAQAARVLDERSLMQGMAIT